MGACGPAALHEKLSAVARGPAAGLLIAGVLVIGTAHRAFADEHWQQVLHEAAGQTVFFNAWGGDLAINRYIEWAGSRLRAEYGVELTHVKVTDIAEAVTRIKAERVAGRDRDGSIDLLWINGENFAELRRADLLYGPWTSQLPNAELVAWQANPTTLFDGALPTAGFELPWGTSSLTFFYDTLQVPDPPRDPAAMLRWIKHNPGRFTYPQPPAFLGSAFLKQMLLLLADDQARLLQPVGNDFDAVTGALWAWLDAAHRDLWRSGRIFPQSGPAQRELLAIGEVDWMLSYNPAEASRAIGAGDLHATIGALQLSGGALSNSHFLAIPYNSGSTAGARVAANFLISPPAQLRKADEQFWGDTPVLDPQALAAAERAQLERLQRGAATPPPDGRKLPEPHPSWTTELERAWLVRYLR